MSKSKSQISPAAARRIVELKKVADCILRDRTATHGEAEDSFKDIAAVWSIILKDTLTKPLEAEDVALMMVGFKMCRAALNRGHGDNWVDMAGYSAIGGGIMAGKREV